MIRRTALVLAAAAAFAIGAGCSTPRTSDIPGAYTEGGYGSPFYAEVSYAKKEGQKPRIFLFGKIAHYNKFLEEKDVPENAHKKFIGKGKNRETIVVQDLMGFELKDNPKYTDKLLAKYQARHNLTGAAPVAESAPAPAVAAPLPAAEAAPAAPVPAAEASPAAPVPAAEAAPAPATK